jgi:uncharacterized protein YggE
MMSMRPRYLLTLGLVLTVLVAASVAAFFLSFNGRSASPTPATQALSVATLAASSTADTITVVGSGTSTAVPDQATVVLGVAALRPNVHDAVATANADMNRLLTALHGQGVLDKDIQTISVGINQQTNCCPSVVIGYQASNQVSVTIHHLANVSAVLMAVVDAVGNDVQLNGVNLFVSNPAPSIAAARASAMTDAAARAGAWAKLAGHHVGGMISLSEVVGSTPIYSCGGRCGGAGGGGGLPVQAGQTTFTVTITATYELAP